MRITLLGMIAVVTALILIVIALAYNWDGAAAKANAQ
jgi:hypothetical protein